MGVKGQQAHLGVFKVDLYVRVEGEGGGWRMGVKGQQAHLGVLEVDIYVRVEGRGSRVQGGG